jgi:hypothetical protein
MSASWRESSACPAFGLAQGRAVTTFALVKEASTTVPRSAVLDSGPCIQPRDLPTRRREEPIGGSAVHGAGVIVLLLLGISLVA